MTVSKSNEMKHNNQSGESSPSERERFLESLNGLTRTILLSEDWNATLHALAYHIREIIGADDCYILGWDEERQWPIPITTTARLDFSFSESTYGRNDELDITRSVLREGHVLAVEDARNSPYIDVNIVSRFPSKSGIAVPLIAGGQKLGAFVIGYNTLRQFTSEEIERAEQAGNQIALALLTFRQSLEIQQRLKESLALAKIERTLSETERIGIGQILQLIVDSARELMPHAEKSVIHLWDAKQQVLVAQAVSGFPKHENKYSEIKMRFGEGIAGHVLRDGITINVRDVKSHPQFFPGNSKPKFQALMVAPIQSEGKLIGTLSVQSAIRDAFSSEDENLLNALAVHSAIAIENTSLFETTQQQLKEVNTLYQISRGLAASLDADQLIREMISEIQRSFNYYHVQIYLVDHETGNLIVRHGSGYIGSELVNKGHHVPVDEGIVGHVAATGEPFMTNNVDEVLFYKRTPLLPYTQFEMAIPIKIETQVMGVLDIQQTPDHDRFTSNDLQLLTAVADHLAMVLQKANLYSTLQTSLQKEKEMHSQLLQSERLALVGRLLASVSHELNNPMQAIQNALFLLKDEEQLSTQGKQDLDVVLSEVERMSSLIERLRSAYRPGRVKDFRPVELNHLIEEVHNLIASFLRQKQIAFEFHPDPGLLPISGMSDQMQQVMLNLFLNAIDAMEPGGRIIVQTCNLVQQNEVLLTVKDTGPGIDPEILPKVFDAFTTGKPTGTGLGLMITRDIIEQHFGRIEAENDPEGGAVFNIWLPIDGKGQA